MTNQQGFTVVKSTHRKTIAVGFDSLVNGGISRKSAKSAAFPILLPVLVARMGGRNPCWLAPAVPSLSTHSSCRPHLTVSAPVFKPERSRHIMIISPAPIGAKPPASETFKAARPCVKCGATERYKNGKCRACARACGAIHSEKNAEKARARTAAWTKANPERKKANDAAWAKANPDKKKANGAAWAKANLGRRKAANVAWSEANKEKIKANKAAYNAANPEKVKANGAAWRAANPEKVKADGAAWRAANREKIQAAAAARYLLKKEEMKARAAAWYAANPERAKASGAARYAANPEGARIGRQNRRARVRAAGGILSKGVSIKLFSLQKGLCPCCQQPLGSNFHLDHIMPLALGGTNTDDNVQLLRATCNQQKQAKHPVDFMQSRGYLL